MVYGEAFEDKCPDCGHEWNWIEDKEIYEEEGFTKYYMICRNCGERFIFFDYDNENN